MGMLWLAACGVLVYGASLSLLGEYFIYGRGHAARPIPAVVLCYALGWAGFALAAFLVMHRGSACSAAAVAMIVMVGLAARVAILPSNLIQENDCYRYVLDGEAVARGVNPFRFAPQEVLDGLADPFVEDVGRPDVRRTLGRIGYPDIPTIYPPFAQAAFAAGAMIWKKRMRPLVLSNRRIISGMSLSEHIGSPNAKRKGPCEKPD